MVEVNRTWDRPIGELVAEPMNLRTGRRDVADLDGSVPLPCSATPFPATGFENTDSGKQKVQRFKR